MTSADPAPVRMARLAARPLAVVVIALALVAVALAGAHLLDQHQRYGSWAWSSASATPRLPFRDRDYMRGPTLSVLQPGDVRLGTTWDGLPIWGRPSGAYMPTGLAVQVGPTAFVYYALMGGP